MLLLLQEPHLTTLFDLLEMLASFKPPSGEVAMEDSEVMQSHFIRTITFKSYFNGPGFPVQPIFCLLCSVARDV